MGYKQNNPIPMMKSAMHMRKAEKKAGMHRDSAMYMNSPMEAGHESPAMNYDTDKGSHSHPHSPMNKESAELKDMPIVDIEKGDAKGDGWIDARKKQPKSERVYGSPAKKQGYNDRLDESLAKDGKESSKKQSMKDRRDESKGMEKAEGKGAYSSDPGMSRKSSPANKKDERSGYNYAPDASTQAARQIGKDSKGDVTGDIDKDIYNVTGATHREVYTNPTTGKFWNSGDRASFNEDKTHGDYNYNKDFNETFRLARKDGVKTFNWRGKKFNTKMA